MPKIFLFSLAMTLCACAAPYPETSTSQANSAVFVPFDPQIIRESKVWQDYAASLAAR